MADSVVENFTKTQRLTVKMDAPKIVTNENFSFTIVYNKYIENNLNCIKSMRNRDKFMHILWKVAFCV